jgi:hypothetical protein
VKQPHAQSELAHDLKANFKITVKLSWLIVLVSSLSITGGRKGILLNGKRKINTIATQQGSE